MKHDLRIIGYITFTIFILLWINQLFSGIKLYETVKTRWQIHLDSIIESVIPPYMELLQTDSVQKQTHLLSSLDSALRAQTLDAVHFAIAQVRQHTSNDCQVPGQPNMHIRHNTGKNLPDK